MAKKIGSIKIPKGHEKGYLRYVDKEGDVFEMKAKGRKKGSKTKKRK